ncbi:MAG: hypothetical protein BGN85_07060 [Alphaproteobacteria bacterium 64-11]|nr:MAG: hypothetical protein BGN85_07060 [Alphaproteobacteria bacterium 64-11]
MTQTSEPESPRPKRKTEARGNGVEAFFPFNLSQFHAENTATMTRANEIFFQAARSVLENETELFRLQTERARAALAPMKTGTAPSQAFPEALEQFHRSTEQAIGHMRAISDAMRECEWQLLALAAGSMAGIQGKSSD